jgi:hypothetical protein
MQGNRVGNCRQWGEALSALLLSALTLLMPQAVIAQAQNGLLVQTWGGGDVGPIGA